MGVSLSFRQLQAYGRNGHAKSSTVVQHFPFFTQFLQKFIAFWQDLGCSRGSYDALKSFCIKKGRQDRQQSRLSQALTGSASKWEWLWRNVSPQHRLESESGYSPGLQSGAESGCRVKEMLQLQSLFGEMGQRVGCSIRNQLLTYFPPAMS